MRPLKQNSYCSSQKSPNIVLTEPPTKDLGSYFNMFLQDFCCYTVFQTVNHNSELFTVSSQELRRLLCYRDPSFLHYGFVQHINEVVATEFHKLQKYDNYTKYKLLPIKNKPYDYGCYLSRTVAPGEWGVVYSSNHLHLITHQPHSGSPNQV